MTLHTVFCSMLYILCLVLLVNHFNDTNTDDLKCYPYHSEKFWGWCQTKNGDWIHVMSGEHPLLKEDELAKLSFKDLIDDVKME